MTAIPPKHLLRERILAARMQLSPDERATKSRRAAERLLSHPVFQRARTVALYAAMGAEADPSAVAHAARRAGKRTVFPRLLPGSRALAFAACAPDELVPGARGTREPPASAPEVPPGELDLVLVPGVAFDPLGGRLGRGGGHYDATLAAIPATAWRAALAFDLQLVPAVPREPHDAAVDLVATESRLVEASRLDADRRGR